ncbi:hypothetical protein GCM10022409_09040 [Hymenobacter glaciei]|uniref:Uncharacterized protein n=1 Tax=Hymenobacter glaciei TaxID=877209 RepID=A0ABP7TJZ1_9BACT
MPLSLVYCKDLRKDGNAVCFTTGYAAYGTSVRPYFSRRSLALLKQGVILAETHLRGGSEKGQKWYLAGQQAQHLAATPSKTKKWNSATSPICMPSRVGRPATPIFSRPPRP